MTAIVSNAGGEREPDNIVSGSGSYTIPAGFWAKVSISTSTTTAMKSGSNTGHQLVADAAANSIKVTLREGDAITVSNSFPAASFSDTNRVITSYARVLVNGIVVCSAYAKCNGHGAGGTAGYYTSSGESNWIAELYAK